MPLQGDHESLNGSPFTIEDPRFERALAAVDRAETLPELQNAVEALIEPYGLQHVVYHALRIPQADISHVAMVFTYPEDWIKHYLSRRYYSIDPVVRAGERGIIPFDWSSLDRSSRAVRRLFDEAADAKIGINGLSVPLRGPGGDHALFTVTSDLPEADWRALKHSYMRDMQLIAVYVHGCVLRLIGPAAPDPGRSLSSRERECLQWAAAGKTIEDTATILNLSTGMVRNYLDSARHKLGCLTKPQAVARALQLGIISF